jgi:hypothetical protein
MRIMGLLSLLWEAMSVGEACPPSAAFLSFTAPLSFPTIASSLSPPVHHTKEQLKQVSNGTVLCENR